MDKLPLSRHKDVVIQELGKEILVYDLLTHKAYHLNETATLVYKSCDGKTAFAELRIKTKFTDEIIFLALDELKKENLLEEDDSYSSPFAGVTRREVIRRVGLTSMIAFPVISSLVAPTASMAQSTCVNPGGASAGTFVSDNSGLTLSCTQCRNGLNSQCCSGAVTNFT